MEDISRSSNTGGTDTKAAMVRLSRLTVQLGQKAGVLYSDHVRKSRQSNAQGTTRRKTAGERTLGSLEFGIVP
jgi:hypothetical protein